MLPTKLSQERFYERFAHLYRLAEARTRIGWEALWSLVKMGVQGRAWVVGRVYSAVRDMRDPKGYLAYPGSVRKPDFVPEGFGRGSWVDRGRSYLSLRIARPAGGAPAPPPA